MTRYRFMFGLFVLACAAPLLDAHGGLLRRLFGPRPSCELHPAAKPEAPPANTLEGRVTFLGKMPEIRSHYDSIKRHPDREYILNAPADHFLDPTWRIDPKMRGVANVCVYFIRPKEGMLPILAEDKVRKEPVVLDAPYSFITPHMSAAYPEWYDGKERGTTGQKIIFKNSANRLNVFRILANPKYNKESMITFSPGPPPELLLKPQPLPVHVHSVIHSWGAAYLWVFDHPYFAITKADGTFTIPRIPVGMEVQVMAWHEAHGWLFTRDGRKMTLKSGKYVLDFTINDAPPR